ncbi:MAG: fibronectin type III domain-containing protein [Ectothiorhodospiraceae bacterium]|nr:fibronectin type III domain-containing protein [Ectothiorhodospiraceae bacterium]
MGFAAAVALSGCISDSGIIDNNRSGGGGSSDNGTVDQGVVPANEDVTLSWTPPESRTDGSPISLSDIERYEILYGTSSGDYSESVSMNANSCNCYEFGRLSEGTYYVAVKATDVNGISSTLSREVSFTVRDEVEEDS